MRNYLLVLVWFCVTVSSAQNFKAEGTLPQVDSSGFYWILVPTQGNVYSNDGFTNLRIHDSAGKEIPYLLEEEKPAYTSEEFIEYPILEKKLLTGCCTSLTLSNPDRKAINNISLLIRNAEVSKRATLLGSDDQKEWYALKEQFFLKSINNSSGTSEIKVVDFPLNNYSYLSLRIDDSTSAPLNILKAGYYDVIKGSGVYTEIPFQKIVIGDSVLQKKTYIHLNLDTTLFIDKVELTMGGSPYFLRNAQLWERVSRDTKQGEKKFFKHVTSFEINSTQSSVIHLPSTKTDRLRIIISNEDNPSLKLVSAKVFQLNRYLVAWLEKGKDYKVKFGDEELDRPEYDLTFFKDSIPAHPPILKLSKIQAAEIVTMVESSPTFFTTRYFIWGAIIVVIGVLGFLSIRLIKDASNSK